MKHAKRVGWVQTLALERRGCLDLEEARDRYLMRTNSSGATRDLVDELDRYLIVVKERKRDLVIDMQEQGHLVGSHYCQMGR